MSPTSHCAILRASPMLQAPSRFTSHASGWGSWLHCRSCTSNWATTSASPMLTTPSPLTSPQGTGTGVVIVLVSKVTAPFRANALPSSVAPVASAIDVRASMFPLKTEVVPRVAELPTCQKTLAAWALPLRMTWRPDVVVRVDAIWKMKTALASPWASSVRSPDDISSEDVDLDRPGVRVGPPGFPASVIAPTVRPAASLYAVVKSSCAWAAAESATCLVPLTVPGGNPVTEVPGLSPRSPVTVLAPVLVTVEPARTAKLAADPRATGARPPPIVV